jgi:hypothetical protein
MELDLQSCLSKQPRPQVQAEVQAQDYKTEDYKTEDLSVYLAKPAKKAKPNLNNLQKFYLQMKTKNVSESYLRQLKLKAWSLV